MGHPAMCETLNQAAIAAGASVNRGVKSIKVQSGNEPSVSYRLEDADVTLRPKLIVGADGRNSVVQRQLEFEMRQDPPHNLLGGMLVEGKTSWPQDAFTAGTEGNIHFLIFPQGEDRLRLYLCYDFDDRARFTGPDREKNLLQAFRLKCLPMGEEIAQCKPISAFHSYSNEDHWTENPTKPGVVLIGDAAGHCDPITGQGLSIGLRDVRIVSDILAAGDWSEAAFEPYVDERLDRMRRLRFAGQFVTKLRAEFGEDARQRRARASRRTNVEGYPSPNPSALIGPEVLPAEFFEQKTIDALMAP
jgi:2-polyprenyl-6-methoxyphenol hydroxylase-like FAD-dependent oxidoreductase